MGNTGIAPPPSGSTIPRRRSYGYLHRHRAGAGAASPLPLSAAQRRAAHRAEEPHARGSRPRDADVERHAVDADGRRGVADRRSSSRAPTAGAVLRDGGQSTLAREDHHHRHVAHARRLEVARALGADVAIDVQRRRAARVLGAPTSAASTWSSIVRRAPAPPVLLGIEATASRRHDDRPGRGNQKFPDFRSAGSRAGHDPKSACGHSYRAVETAQLLASHRFRSISSPPTGSACPRWTTRSSQSAARERPMQSMCR